MRKVRNQMEHKLLSPAVSSAPVMLVFAGMLATGIFVIDTLTTLDIAIAVLYVVVVLLAANVFQRRGVLLVSSGCMALTVVAYLLSHPLPRTPPLSGVS